VAKEREERGKELAKLGKFAFKGSTGRSAQEQKCPKHPFSQLNHHDNLCLGIKYTS